MPGTCLAPRIIPPCLARAWHRSRRTFPPGCPSSRRGLPSGWVRTKPTKGTKGPRRKRAEAILPAGCGSGPRVEIACGAGDHADSLCPSWASCEPIFPLCRLCRRCRSAASCFAGPVQGPRPRPRGRRDGRPDRRLGSRPFTRAEMERLFLNRRGLPLQGERYGRDGGSGGSVTLNSSRRPPPTRRQDVQRLAAAARRLVRTKAQRHKGTKARRIGTISCAAGNLELSVRPSDRVRRIASRSSPARPFVPSCLRAFVRTNPSTPAELGTFLGASSLRAWHVPGT